MALLLQMGSSYCIRTEIFRHKCGQNVGLSRANNIEAAKLKENCIGLSSVSCYPSRKTQILHVDEAVLGHKRGHSVIVAASPPTEDAVIITEPLTKEDLVGYLASGCKPKENWRIGTEHEKFGFELKTLRPMKYEQIAELLNGISERFDWEKVMEGDKIIGLKQGKQSISLEPGGQFELSGAPLETLHQTCAEVNSHLYQVKAVTEEMGIGFLGIGFQPKWRIKDIPIMPKGRYEIMRNYMPKVGTLGLDMMFRTCTVQVNLDFSSEADMIRKFRAGLALQPIATALFANSPFTEGKPNGFLSMRSQIWTDTDNNRTGMLPFVFDDSFGFEQYVDYALDVPMYFVYRKKKYIDCTGMTFRDFLAGKLSCIPGELPTLNDWENHLTTIFPEVRLKRYLEMRGADGGPWRRLCALPAFWVGILYDEVALQNVLDITADWTPEERQMLRNKVPITGLKTPFRDGLLKHVAQDIVKLAKDGLERRGFKESGFLNEVAEVVRTGVTPAERLLELYNGKWGQQIDPVFEELLY
ncbi:PREDICTED: glutamate--cysteine ligase [Prunus dulcis]|uniref:Glutamate--cysteine ligase, chloroplastic n=2 Tax=Prunus dulcis TaxID=3755 RepID=A0A5E4GLC6_PRUDU|nr:glutamate--cysteine ligase, chloroplastic-like [Prunus dulcis]XP_034215572.1 glutamate--cysteine ligase, chloroplastic-like [Prunus dulcis]VVA40677.1 PREDICTED: glutamate--cysteine ligase [Prunus dulcis]